MKRITLFLLLALYLSLQAFAQIRIGVDAGMNLTHFKSSDNYVQKIGGMGTGFQIGGTLDYEFKKHWMLMSGVSCIRDSVHANPKQDGNGIWHASPFPGC